MLLAAVKNQQFCVRHFLETFIYFYWQAAVLLFAPFLFDFGLPFFVPPFQVVFPKFLYCFLPKDGKIPSDLLMKCYSNQC